MRARVFSLLDKPSLFAMLSCLSTARCFMRSFLVRCATLNGLVCLVPVIRVGDKLNILMEYVPGKSLDTMLDRFGAFNESVIRNYTQQILAALSYCHGKHVVHRDIKGKNILVDTSGNLKICDFGSAKRFDSTCP